MSRVAVDGGPGVLRSWGMPGPSPSWPMLPGWCGGGWGGRFVGRPGSPSSSWPAWSLGACSASPFMWGVVSVGWWVPATVAVVWGRWLADLVRAVDGGSVSSPGVEAVGASEVAPAVPRLWPVQVGAGRAASAERPQAHRDGLEPTPPDQSPAARARC